MWIKYFANGNEVREDRGRGITWLTTPCTDLIDARLINIVDGRTVTSVPMIGMLEYWHSRMALARDNGECLDVAERIQGRLQSGRWATITWDGKRYIETIEEKAFGKPVVK